MKAYRYPTGATCNHSGPAYRQFSAESIRDALKLLPAIPHVTVAQLEVQVDAKWYHVVNAQRKDGGMRLNMA